MPDLPVLLVPPGAAIGDGDGTNPITTVSAHVPRAALPMPQSGSSSPPEVHQREAAVVAGYGRAFPAGADPTVRPVSVDAVMLDVLTQAHDRYGVSGSVCYLLRPDTVVAVRAPIAEWNRVNQHVLSIFTRA